MKLKKLVILTLILGLSGFIPNVIAQNKSDENPISYEAKDLMAGDNQKMNLDVATSDRFALTDIVWPTNIGEADVCLWHNDKIAATTITIDDNIEYEHEWWLTMHYVYNLDLTWFVILNSVSSWDKYQTLIDAGNEVQGHDNCGINDYDTASYRVELQKIKDQINTNLTRNYCKTYAYPCGDQSKQEVARSMYISMRGVTGVLNKVNRIDYLDLKSRSATNDVHDIRVLLDPAEKLYNNSYYRGWASYHYHSISSKKTETELFLMALSAKTDSIWVGKYSEVACYAQERDSHTLTVDESDDTSIKLTLTDEMKDEYFDFPLTVKVRINNDWEHISATQNSEEIEAEIIEHENNKYVLLKIVPDRGQVILSNIVNTAPSINPIGNQTVSENSSITLYIATNDEDGNPVTLSTENLPSFGNLKDNGDGSGEIVFNPQTGDNGSYENIVVKASDGLESSISAFDLLVTDATGVSDFDSYGINVYPNPAINGEISMTLNANLLGEYARVDILNSTAKLIFTKEITEVNEKLSITIPGVREMEVLFVKLTTKSGTSTQKVLLNSF